NDFIVSRLNQTRLSNYLHDTIHITQHICIVRVHTPTTFCKQLACSRKQTIRNFALLSKNKHTRSTNTSYKRLTFRKVRETNNSTSRITLQICKRRNIHRFITIYRLYLCSNALLRYNWNLLHSSRKL